jgi:uncharacterized protein
VLIKVIVKTNSKQPRVEPIDNSTFVAYVDERAVAGKANRRLLEILSEHFKVPKSRITIIRGAKSTDKVVKISADLEHTR